MRTTQTSTGKRRYYLIINKISLRSSVCSVSSASGNINLTHPLVVVLDKLMMTCMSDIRVFIVVICAFFTSCISDFTPEVKGVRGILVVDGMITDGESEFRISRSVGILEDLDSINAVKNAQVYVERSDGFLFEARQIESGVYRIQNGDLDLEREYRLCLAVDGKNYQSTFLRPQVTPPIDSVSWQKKGRLDPVTIHVSTHSRKEESPYYRWSYKENWEVKAQLYANAGYIGGQLVLFDLRTPNNTYYCWARDSSKTLLLGNTEALTENTVLNEPLLEIATTDERLSILYHVEVLQMRLREEAYRYFLLLRDESERTGGLFNQVMSAGNNGNVFCVSDPEEIVIGYVEVATVTRQSIYIPTAPDLYVEQLYDDCFTFYGYENNEGMYWLDYVDKKTKTYPHCVDCRRKSHATKNKPSWWPTDHL